MFNKKKLVTSQISLFLANKKMQSFLWSFVILNGFVK